MLLSDGTTPGAAHRPRGASVQAAIPLRRRTLPQLASRLDVPSYDAADLVPGIVHLGLGSFARAHVAVYLDRMAELGISRDWGLVGSGLRSGAIAAPLARQDHLWTVAEAGRGRARVVGALQGYVDASRDEGQLLATLTDPRTRVVTLTITAPAYDLGAGIGSRCFRLLAEALRRRYAAGTGPFTVLSCDNLPDSGGATRAGVLAAAEQVDDGLRSWIHRNVAFPSGMVDRITPMVADSERLDLRRRHGVDDRLVVVAESFSQWVVTDEFCAGRPPLDEVGVQVVTDVQPFVDAKTRLLNGGHVALGFMGSRTAHRTTAEAMRDPELSAFVTRLLREEVVPLLAPVPGTDLDAYLQSVLGRFADESIADGLPRLCRRGSVRVRNYIVPSLRDAVAEGRPYGLLMRVVAAWVQHLRRAGDLPGGLSTLEDPMARQLLPLAAVAPVDPRPLLAVTEVFGDLGRHPGVVTSLRRALAELESDRRAEAS